VISPFGIPASASRFFVKPLCGNTWSMWNWLRVSTFGNIVAINAKQPFLGMVHDFRFFDDAPAVSFDGDNDGGSQGFGTRSRLRLTQRIPSLMTFLLEAGVGAMLERPLPVPAPPSRLGVGPGMAHPDPAGDQA
jgi:hypothetical protein